MNLAAVDNSNVFYNVVERPLFVSDVTAQVCDLTRGMLSFVPKSKMLMREDTGSMLAIVGQGYHVVQNRDLYSHVTATLEQELSVEEQQGITIKDEVSYNGRDAYRTYIIPAITARIGASEIALRIIVSNSFGSGAIRMIYGAIDFFCTNGMVSGIFDMITKKHTKGFSLPSFLGKIRECIRCFRADSQQWVKWHNTPVTDIKVIDTLAELVTKKVVSKKLGELIATQYAREVEDRGKNVWALYSAFTQWSSHTDVQKVRGEADNDNRKSSLLKREEKVALIVRRPEWLRLAA